MFQIHGIVNTFQWQLFVILIVGIINCNNFDTCYAGFSVLKQKLLTPVEFECRALKIHIFSFEFNELCSLYGQRGEVKWTCPVRPGARSSLSGQTVEPGNSLIESWAGLVDSPLHRGRQLASGRPWIPHPLKFCSKTCAAVNSHKSSLCTYCIQWHSRITVLFQLSQVL